jgi:hypothetical protein
LDPNDEPLLGKEFTMSLQAVAKKLVELCNQGKNFDAMHAMYAPSLEEVGVYTVKDDKVTREQFFYDGKR